MHVLNTIKQSEVNYAISKQQQQAFEAIKDVFNDIMEYSQYCRYNVVLSISNELPSFWGGVTY